MTNRAGRPTQPADAFEASIETRGEVLHRDKVVSRSLALIMLLCTVGFLAASIAYASGLGAEVSTLAKVLTYALTPLFPFVLLTRTVLRTVVTTEEVSVKWGLWGPTIPVGSITACEHISKEQMRREGTFAPQLLIEDAAGTTRRIADVQGPGNFEQSVLIEWVDASGSARTVLVASEDPVGMVAAIRQARRRAQTIRPASAGDEAELTGEDDDEAVTEDELDAPREKRA